MLGVHLTLMAGPTVAVPVPPPVVEALESAEVTHSDQGRSGFQLTFQMGRSGPLDVVDYPLLLNPLLKPFNRVILLVTFDVVPRVLMDGVITDVQFTPGERAGASRLTVTGEDVSLMMDLKQKPVEHPAQDETVIALMLIGTYAQYGLIPMVLPPPVVDPPLPIERTPVQTQTDLGMLQDMAERHGYVFYVAPGPAPFTNTAYWGPPIRQGPQAPLSVNMGPDSNVDTIRFQYSANEPVTFNGQVQDRQLNQVMPYMTFSSLRPPLAAMPAGLVQQPNVRQQTLNAESGLTYTQALARAQGRTDAASDRVLTATGELSALRYGALLQARGVVGLRGAGYLHDGLYYVKEVSHSIRHGEYKQRFTLTREGYGSTVPVL